MLKIHRVGVLGCGIMGSGIAALCAKFGYDVIICDSDSNQLSKGLASIQSQLYGEGITRHVKSTTRLNDLRQADLIVEAITEKLEIKMKVFSELDRICSPETIFVSNTSSLPILEMAMATGRPERVLGMHFFQPLLSRKLMEVAGTLITDSETLQIGKGFGESLGKTVIIVKDTPGFIVNRLAISFRLNAIRTLEAGIAGVEEIDTAIKLALEHPYGPFISCDRIGLDTLCHIADSLYEQTKDRQYAAPPLLRKMVAAGWLGRKSGKGFYDYTSDEPGLK